MNILIAGIYRSGSTWLYNAVRFLTEESGLKTQGSFARWEIKEGFDCHVVKTHYTYTYKRLRFTPDYIITSIRDREDIIKSMKAQRKKELDPQFENAGKYEDINEYFLWLNYWEDKPNHVYQMDFEDLDKKRINKILSELNNVLKLELNNTQLLNVEKRLSELRPPLKGFDHDTLLTPTHIK